MRQSLEFTQKFCAEIHGWLEDEEVEWLWKEANTLPAKGSWIEVGTWKGKSFAATALGASSNTTIIAVDTFLGTPSEMTTYHAEAMESGDPIFVEFQKNLAKLAALRPTLKLGYIRQNSLPVANATVHNSLDRVFLDAAHDYNSVLIDILMWHRTVKPSGKLIGHDYDLPDVRRAVKDCGMKIERGPIDLWWIQK